MARTPYVEHTVLRCEQTTVVVEYGDDGRARLDVESDAYRGGSAAAARLACEAVHEARLRHAARVEGALDAASPASGAILEALHRQIGGDLESIAMRRAGSSVMVTLEMHADPTTPPAVPAATSLVPSR